MCTQCSKTSCQVRQSVAVTKRDLLTVFVVGISVLHIVGFHFHFNGKMIKAKATPTDWLDWSALTITTQSERCVPVESIRTGTLFKYKNCQLTVSWTIPLLSLPRSHSAVPTRSVPTHSVKLG